MSYPAIEQIYDLSTEELKKLEKELSLDQKNHQQLLETVQLQIQERKALEFFAELCHADNPYARKVAAFNEEFLKLAAEAIQKNHNARLQGQGVYEPTQILSENQLKFKKEVKKQEQQTNVEKKSEKSVKSLKQISSHQRQQTDNQTKSVQSQYMSNKSQSDFVSTSNSKSQANLEENISNTSRMTAQVKMNIGAKKGGKNSKMKQIMQNTLARTLVEDDGLIKRNNNTVKPNPFKKSELPPKPKDKDKEKQERIKPAAEKNGNEATKKEASSKKDEGKKKNMKQIAQKMKEENKKGSVKLPKIGQYKDLVDMVRDEQQKKKSKSSNKTSSNYNQKLPLIDHPTVNHSLCTDEVEEKKMEQLKHQKRLKVREMAEQQKNTEPEDSTDNDRSEISQTVQVESIKTVKQQEIEKNNERTKKQDCEDRVQKKKSQESVTPNLKIQLKDKCDEKIKQRNQIQEAPSKKEIDHRHNLETTYHLETTYQKNVIYENLRENQKVQDHRNLQLGKKTIGIDENMEGTMITSQKQRNFSNQYNHAQAIDYTKKLLEQIDREQEQMENKIVSQQRQQKLIQINLRQISPNSFEQQPIEQRQRPQSTKKCYSEEYWAHIREEAELKIKRFKQEKQMEEKISQQRANLTDRNICAQKNELYNEKQENDQQWDRNKVSNSVIKKIKEEQVAFQKQINTQNQQLNKLKKDLVKKANKKTSAENQPNSKIIFLRPKPDFNYLQVYPTFNHIFSVMYLKPQSQALNQIPNILRELRLIFANHIDHFSNKFNFKPAIFLPFDHNGAFQLTDPKQMILHAQETYIDLKVIMQRVQKFNQNLHGQFQDINTERFYRVVKTKEEVYDIITTSFMRRKGWKQLPHGCSLRSSWNLFWSWSKPDVDLNKLLVWQRINHFPFNKNLSRKDLLYKNLDHFRKSYKISMNFLPTTYNLPKQFSQLSAKFHQEQVFNRDKNYWIMKPIGKSRGRGIKVVSSLSQLNYTDNIVVQKYILNPMLIEGYKFDMRIYVLVTSFHPLEAFVYREGFARLSTQKYTLDPQSIKNTFVHLTNFAINKNNVGNSTNFSGGSKISLKTLKDKLTRLGYSFSNIWGQVHDIIVKSLLGCSISVPSFPTAFELFGYDIMIDQDCNCHLIEINASPSLQRSYMIDQIVKQNLIDDIIDLVDPPDFDKKEMLQVFNQRIQSFTNKKKLTPDEDLIGLARILKYKPLRKVGEKPQKLGLFQVVAPCDLSRELQTLIKAKSGANNPLNID